MSRGQPRRPPPGRAGRASLLRALGVVANFQPLWARADSSITDLTLPILRPDTHREIYPIGSVLRSGAVVGFYVNFQDDKTGSIEAGKLADLIVLDHNLFAIDPNDISDAKVLLTLLGGKPVYGDLKALGRI